MDRVEEYRQAIETILTKYAQIPYAHGEIEAKTLFDHDANRYMLLTIGWDGIRRVHGCLVHIDIIDGKLWIQRDDTDLGIARELEEAGIPKEQMVLGFQTPDVRPFTEYAVA
ncbi:XisI protein [Chloroflexi bacterium TSY]|nr:XisI protein [Chloroflexi bacterium TSY]